jgi:hypothetical protein
VCTEEFFSSEDGYGTWDVPDSNCTAGKKGRISSFQKEQLKDGYVTPHKTHLTWVQKEVVKQKVQSIHSEIPIVVAVMSKFNVDSGCSPVSSIFLMRVLLRSQRRLSKFLYMNINVNTILDAVNS